jgi:hypothetical protein
MAIHRTAKVAAKPAKAATPKATHPAKKLAPKTPVLPRQRKPEVAAVPKVAARVVKHAEIQLVRKVDRVMTDVKHTAQIYRGMEADGAGRLKAIASAYGHLFQGAEEIQQPMWDIVQQTVGAALSAPREFAQCKNFTEIAAKQQDFVHGFVGRWATASHAVLAASRRVVDRAIRPLESQLLDTAG